jgi:hypothetical protein
MQVPEPRTRIIRLGLSGGIDLYNMVLRPSILRHASAMRSARASLNKLTHGQEPQRGFLHSRDAQPYLNNVLID